MCCWSGGAEAVQAGHPLLSLHSRVPLAARRGRYCGLFCASGAGIPRSLRSRPFRFERGVWPPLSFGHFPRERGQTYASGVSAVSGGNLRGWRLGRCRLLVR